MPIYHLLEPIPVSRVLRVLFWITTYTPVSAPTSSGSLLHLPHLPPSNARFIKTGPRMEVFIIQERETTLVAFEGYLTLLGLLVTLQFQGVGLLCNGRQVHCL